jgi:tetratricopeptide (TPR) repeat protein
MMKKMRLLTFIVLIFASLLISVSTAHGAAATSYTMTFNAKFDYVRTQDAYLPDKTIINLNLKSAQDMYFDENDILFISDTDNKRIIKYDPSTNTILQEITYAPMVKPTGIFVSERGIYIADPTAATIFRFDLDGNYVEQFDRPTTPSFADTPYNPNKVVVDNRGNLYIYGEGVKDGIIQLTNTGEFSGYFTSNKVQLSFTQQVYKVIFSEEQFEEFAARDPRTFANIFIDKDMMIYTVTGGTYRNAIKKHNTQGGNIFDTFSTDRARDVYVDENGIVYAGMENGLIFVYTREGEFIFNFGSSNFLEGQINPDISGLFTKLSAIAVDSTGKLYALDESKNFLQSFVKTEYTEKIYQALDLYNDRNYEEAIVLWEDVLKLNQMSVIAHNNIAKSYLQQEDYEQAMYHFELAGNRSGYSEAYWEVRNVGIQQALGAVIILIVVLYITMKVVAIVDHKTGKIHLMMQPVKNYLDKKLLKDIFYFFRVMRHPLDSFYEMKKGHKTTWYSAVILYVLIFLSFINYSVNKGFIYQFVAVEDMDIWSLILGFFGITLMLIISNYLDTSIHDGIGGIKQIFIMFVYALGPLLIALNVTALLSHVLTYNETFFLSLIMNVGFVWSFINVFLGIIETHDYTARQAIKSIIMTIVFSLIMVVVIILMIMMWEQLYQFIQALLKEAIRNATN